MTNATEGGGKRYLGHDGAWYNVPPCPPKDDGVKLIIGLSGRKQSGKDTAARQIAELWCEYRWPQFVAEAARRLGEIVYGPGEEDNPRDARILHFADPIKGELISRGWITRAQAYGTDEQKNMASKVTRGDRVRIYEFTAGKPYSGYLDSERMSARELMQWWGQLNRAIDPDVWVNITMRRATECPEPLVLIADVRFPNEVEAIQDAGGRVIRLLRNPFPDNQDETETALDGYLGFDEIVYPKITISEQAAYLRRAVTPWFQETFGKDTQ